MGCDWSLIEQWIRNDIRKQFYCESVMSDILLQFKWESKNKLTLIDFYLWMGTGIIDKWFQLKFLGNQKNIDYGMRSNW